MSYALDYGEPIPQVVWRLKKEHRIFSLKLSEIEAEVKKGNPRVAASLLNAIKEEILRHAVE